MQSSNIYHLRPQFGQTIVIPLSLRRLVPPLLLLTRSLTDRMVRLTQRRMGLNTKVSIITTHSLAIIRKPSTTSSLATSRDPHMNHNRATTLTVSPVPRRIATNNPSHIPKLSIPLLSTMTKSKCQRLMLQGRLKKLEGVERVNLIIDPVMLDGSRDVIERIGTQGGPSV